MVAAENIVMESDKKLGQLPVLLLIDDHPLTAGIEKNYFIGVGFRVTLCSKLKEAEHVLVTQNVDILVIDVSFSNEKGLEMVKIARNCSKNKDLKVLVTSVLATPEMKKNILKSGANEFLIRPAPREKILRSIKKLTSQKTRDQERITKSFLCICKIEDDILEAHSLDFSADGIHLALSDPARLKPNIGTLLTLNLEFDEHEKQLSLSGTVVRHTEQGFGVRFSEIGKLTKRSLDKLLLRYSMNQKMSQFYL